MFEEALPRCTHIQFIRRPSSTESFLSARTFGQKLTWDSLLKVKALAQRNKVVRTWTLGHQTCEVKDTADDLAIVAIMGLSEGNKMDELHEIIDDIEHNDSVFVIKKSKNKDIAFRFSKKLKH